MRRVTNCRAATGLRTEEHEDGPHAAMVLGRRGKVELREDTRDVPLDGTLSDHEYLGDCLIAATLCHQAKHLALPRGQHVQWIVCAFATGR